jgi:hypothetical protein
MAFSDKLHSIKRAKMETTLKEEDLKGPFGTEKDQMACALKVANETAADLILVGSIDEVKVDAAKKTANVTLSAVIANSRTGTPIKTVAVTGLIASTSDQVITDSDLITLAASDAATKLVREIVPDQPVVIQGQVQGQYVNSSNKKKKSSGIRKFIIPIVVVAVAAIAIAASSGGDDDNDDLDNPPGGSPL